MKKKNECELKKIGVVHTIPHHLQFVNEFYHHFQIKCSWSGHEMPAQVDAVRTYLGGKKFKKLQAENQYDYDRYQPHLVPSTKKFHE